MLGFGAHAQQGHYSQRPEVIEHLHNKGPSSKDRWFGMRHEPERSKNSGWKEKRKQRNSLVSLHGNDWCGIKWQ